MSEKTRKPSRGVTKAEIRAAERYRQTEREKHNNELKRGFRKDFLFYDIFSQLWGWDEYSGNSDPEEAIRRLRQAMQDQRELDIKRKRPLNGDLQFQVGVAYLNGWLPCKNSVEEAWRWFHRSEKRGSPRGKMAIGYLHEKKLLANDDEIAMLSDYTSAAAGGYAPAQYRLAQYYHWQSNPDREQIKDLLTAAAGQQYIPAKYLLAELYPETVHNMEYREIYGYEWDEIARKHKEDGKGIYEPKEEKPDGSSLMEEISKTLKRQEFALQRLQTSLDGMWAEMQEAEEEFRENLQQLQQETKRYLTRISETEWTDAEKFMSVLFKDDWRNPARLCDTSCDYLVDAHVLMKAADKLGITNYCGIVVTAISALEHECRRRFYDAFDSYLASIGVEAQDRKSRMGLQGEHFTLGSVGYVTKSPDYDDFSRTTKLLSPAAQSIRRKHGWTEAKMIFGYRFPGTWDPVRKKEKTFKNMVKDLTDNYRNPAAHAKKVMTSEDAAGCCDLLGITAAHEKVDNITGALKALLWLTAPLEQKE